LGSGHPEFFLESTGMWIATSLLYLVGWRAARDGGCKAHIIIVKATQEQQHRREAITMMQFPARMLPSMN